MKMLFKTFCFCFLLALPSVASADDSAICKNKELEIEAQIAKAKQFNNYNRVRGLEIALEQVKAHCRAGDEIGKAERDVREKEFEVQKAELELAEAAAAGKPDKIAKRQQKLEEARQELEEARAELAGLQ